jgi:hypothetical protein
MRENRSLILQCEMKLEWGKREEKREMEQHVSSLVFGK